MNTVTRTNNQNKTQHNEMLKGYMPEEIAKALSAMYERIELTTHRRGGSKVTIVTVGAADMYQTFQQNDWFNANPEGYTIPQPGDWCVFVNYVKKTIAESGEWTEVCRQDGHIHGDLLGNIAEQYSINL